MLVCPKCGQIYEEQEEHVCSDSQISPSGITISRSGTSWVFCTKKYAPVKAAEKDPNHIEWTEEDLEFWKHLEEGFSVPLEEVMEIFKDGNDKDND